MAAGVNLNEFHRGDTYTSKVTVKTAAGVAIDITGETYWFTMKSDPTVTDANADVQVSVVAAGADATNGIVYLAVPAATSEVLEIGPYSYDIQRVNAGVVTTLMSGKVKVIQDITVSR